MEQREIYIQFKDKARIQLGQSVYLKDLIEIYGSPEDKKLIEEIKLTDNSPQGPTRFTIQMLSVIEMIKAKYPQYRIFTLGSSEMLVNFVDGDQKTDRFLYIRLALVCFLLFMGSITAIINFHSDVDMRQAHKGIYKIVTGVETESPLLLQIPYSLGIGAGMSVFFNHVFKKRINQEPSPLEVEIYMYQQNMDAYLKGNDAKFDLIKKGSK